ncbi:ParB/RepB/Spo0J family partition protein [uncultured Methylophaga sp.]|uniref:ParB/RepB/Spo0J family partition protein n=1 Tax=uncultured Methylophaga sp. TaxID=285271 RepID=UPI002620A378|nr:ParB/RepB/Spo0J family partition protein [uncultured Methylophaga sp.]
MARRFGLLRKDIHIDEYRFQARNPYANELRKVHRRKKQIEQQLEELTEYLKADTKHELEPIKVWKDPLNDKYFVVDGHHRLQAYEEAKRRANRKLPCVVIQAETPHEALAKVFKENSRGKLGYTAAERIEAAWVERCRLERIEEAPTVKHMAQTFGISAGTASNFNKVICKLKRSNGGELPKKLANWKIYAKQPDDDGQEDAPTAPFAASIAYNIGESIVKHPVDVQEMIVAALAERLNDHLKSCGAEGEMKRWSLSLWDADEDF